MTDTPNPIAPPKPEATRSGRSARLATYRRRSVWVIFIIAGLLLLLRIALIFIFPMVLEHVLAYYGLTANYKDIKLDVLGGDAEIWGMKIRPINGGPNVMDVQYCHGNISTPNLFRGQLYVRRAVADGADLFFRRSTNGNCPLLNALLSHSHNTTSRRNLKQSISLAAPLRVEAFRLEHLQLHVVDQSVKPAVHLGVTVNVRVSHLGRQHGATAFRLDLWSSTMVDVLHIEGSLTTGPSALLAKARILMRGLHLQPTAGYLRKMGVRPGPEGLSLSANSTLALHVIKNKTTASEALTALFTLQHFILSSGNRPALGIDNLTAKGRLAGHLVDVQTLSIHGVTLNAGRDKTGLFHFAGLDILRKMVSAGTLRAPVSTLHQPALPVAIRLPGVRKVYVKNAGSYTYSMDRLKLYNVKTVFRDADVRPHARLELTLDTFDAVSSGGLPGTPGQKLTISGTGTAPGIAGALAISGNMQPFAKIRTLTLHLSASKITAAALNPYLLAAGLKSELKSARVNVNVSGTMTQLADGAIAASAHLDDLTYRDGKAPLCDFKHIDADKVSVDPATGRLEIGSLNIVGPSCNLVRETSGHFAVLGMQILGKHAPVLSAPALSPPLIKQTRTINTAIPPTAFLTRTPAPYIPPRFQIDHFSWSGIRVGFDDRKTRPATHVMISHAGLVLNNFILDLSGKSAARKVGTVRAWLQAPGVILRTDVHGTLNPGKNTMQTSLHFLSTGIDLRLLAPYVKPLGIKPVLDHGTFSGNLAAHLALHGRTLAGGVQLTDIQLRQGTDSLAALKSFRLSRSAASRGKLDVQSLLIQAPYLQITRLTNGNLMLCGMELLQKVAANRKAAAIPARAAASPFRTTVNKISLSHAILQWTDLQTPRPVHVRLHANATVTNAFFGHHRPPAGTLQAVLSARGLADQMAIHGSFSVPLNALEANINLQATGLHGNVINAFLPRGIAFIPKGEHLITSLDIHLSHLPDGSAVGNMGISNLNITRPGGGSKPHYLLRLPRAAVNFRRFNLQRRVLAINSINADLKSIHIDRRRGGWSICGIHIGQYLHAKPSSTLRARATPVTPGTFSFLPRQLPLVTLTHLHLHAADILLTGVLPGQHAITLSGLDLQNTTPIRCLGTAPARQPPIALQLTGTANNLAGHVNMAFNLKPFANHPRGKVHILVQAIRGAGIARLLPAVATYFDATALTQGEFVADASAALQISRRSPIDFNLGQGFAATVKVSHAAFRARPHGPILAGVAAMDFNKVDVVPSHPAVTIALLNIRTPSFRITRDAAGFHILGMLLKSAPHAPKGTARKSVSPAPGKAKIKITVKAIKVDTVGAAKPPATKAIMRRKVTNLAKVVKRSIKKIAAVQPPTTRAIMNNPHFPAILVKRLIISGVNGQYIDRTTIPNIVIPLTGLEAQVRNLGTVPLMRHIPIRFNVIAYAGAVSTLPPLPVVARLPAEVAARRSRGTMIGKPAIHNVTVPKQSLFSQFAANGDVYLYPHVQGWSTSSVNGLYLAELEPLAKEFDITLAGGTFNSSSDIRFHANNHIDLHTKLVFSNLNISEPPHGPLAKLLNLPTPLNVAIAAIESPDGSITIPLSVPIHGRRFSRSAISGQVFTDMAQVVAVGLASSPLKLANGLAGLFGSTKVKLVKKPPINLAFAPGSTTLTLQDWRSLQALGRQLQQHASLQVIVQQHISTADLAVAAMRANPTHSQCLQLIVALQARKNRLLVQRHKELGTLRGDLAIRLSHTAINAGTARLASLDSQIAHAQMSINYLANMLARGADRDAARRTRGTMMTIARQRLSEIKKALFTLGFAHPKRRVHIIFPQYTAVKSPRGGNAVLTLVQTK